MRTKYADSPPPLSMYRMGEGIYVHAKAMKYVCIRTLPMWKAEWLCISPPRVFLRQIDNFLLFVIIYFIGFPKNRAFFPRFN